MIDSEVTWVAFGMAGDRVGALPPDVGVTTPNGFRRSAP